LNHTLKYFSLVGSGFAANFFAAYLPLLGLKPAHIWSRNSKKAQFFKEKFDLNWVDNLKDVPQPESLVLLCTPDSSIEQISAQLPDFEGLVAHCSGASPLDYLNPKHKHRAVLWPMASLSHVDSSAVAKVFLSLEDNSDILQSYFLKSNVHFGVHSSSERLKLHLAAVLANNFTHHLLYNTAQICEDLNVPLDIFKNLAKQSLNPRTAKEYLDTQTGPARRNDRVTINNHLEILNNPELKALYEAFNESIKKTYGTEL